MSKLAKFFKDMAKAMPKRTAAILLALAAVLVPVAIFAQGSTHPETLHVATPAQYITFNQYVDNEVWGKEHDFLRVGSKKITSYDDVQGTPVSSFGNVIVANENQEYTVIMYIHNNAASSLNLVATGVKAQIVNINKTAATTQQLRGFIDADNCGAKQDGKGGQTAGTSCTFWDEGGFQSVDGRKFTMEYVKGSAKYIQINNKTTFNLPDTVATASGNNGTLIGDTAMNGKIPGCAEHAGYVVIRVKPKYEPKPPTPVPSYDVEKKVNGTTHNTVKPGDTMTYTITAKNTGNVDLTNVKINDTLPAYYSNATETLPASATGSIINNPHTVTIPKLAVGQTATITISYKIKGETSFQCDKTTNFINKVTSSTDQKGTEDNTNNNQVDTDVTYPCTPPTKVPNYDLEKKADKATAKPGETINYTLTFNNTGETDLTNVTVKDTLPAGLTYVSGSLKASAAYTGDLFGDGIVISRVNVGGTVTITFQAKVNNDAVPAEKCGENQKEFVNKSSSTTNEKTDESDKSNNDVSVTVVVRRECATTKTAANNTQGGVDATTVNANGGDVITYTITAVNTEATEMAIAIKDILTDTLEYATLTDYGGGMFDDETKTLSWQVTLKPGEAVVRNFTVTVNNPVPAMARGQSRTSSYDCIMSNYYGTDVHIPLNCPPEKIIEQVVEQLPATGPGENILFGGIVLAIVIFFYARSKQLGKEVRLVRREFNAGTL